MAKIGMDTILFFHMIHMLLAESPEDGSFAAAFSPCTLNEGMGQEDLNNALISYNAWLDGIDQSAVTVGFYAYGLYIPEG